MFVKNWYKQLACAVGGSADKYDFKYSHNGSAGSFNYGLFYALNSNANTRNPYIGKLITTYSGYGGVIFGDGNIPVTIDDYCLSGNIITTLSGNGTVTWTASDTELVGESTFLLTNTGTSEVTIRECGLFGGANNNNGYTRMLDRTVLDTPVTIPAGGVGQIVYTVRIVFPTA